MKTIRVTLEITVVDRAYSDPKLWAWNRLLSLNKPLGEGVVVVSVEEQS